MKPEKRELSHEEARNVTSLLDSFKNHLAPFWLGLMPTLAIGSPPKMMVKAIPNVGYTVFDGESGRRGILESPGIFWPLLASDLCYVAVAPWASKVNEASTRTVSAEVQAALPAEPHH